MTSAMSAAPTHSSPTASQVAAVISGNALEFYDFLAFSFFTVNIARVLFPASAPGTALLLTILTGSLGFIARPAGAVIFGILGDRIGRRPAMLLSFTLMGLGSLGLALTPSYAQIGIAAPFLAVALRLLQGLAVGGDIGPTTAYLVECSPPNRRGIYAASQLGATRFGAAVSGLVGLALASTMSPAMLDSLGWRIAFGIGALIVPFAFVLRQRLEETLHLPETDPNAPERVMPSVYVAALLGVIGGFVGASVTDFMFTFVSTWLNVPATSGYQFAIALSATQVLCVLAGGWVSDRVGRRTVKFLPAFAGLLITIPLFGWMAATGSFERLWWAALPLVALTSIGQGAAYACFVEIAPKRQRSRLIGIGYGFMVAAAFGFTPPLVAAYLHATGDLRAPAFAWLAGFGMLAVSALLTPETRVRRGQPLITRATAA